MTDKMKDIARSMITASHYNNLPDTELDNYLNSIIAEVQKHLDSPNLREKVARQLSVHKHEGISWDELPVNVKDFILKQADEIIALMKKEV